MKTLIIIPSIFEAEKLSIKTKFHEFTKISENLLLTISGIAKSGLKTIKDIVPKENIGKMILIGMCGDLTDDNRIGDTYIIDSVTNKELTLYINNSSFINKLTAHILKNNNGTIKDIGTASLLTVSKPVFSSTRKLNLSKYAQLVDMETFHYAQLCKELKIGFSAIRVVSDDCKTELKDYFRGIEKDSAEAAGLRKAQLIIKEVFESIVKQLS